MNVATQPGEVLSIAKKFLMAMTITGIVSFGVFAISILSPALYQVIDFFQTYFFSDWEALMYVGVAVSVDTFTGIYASWRSYKKGEGPRPSSNQFARLGDKMVIYGSLFILGHVSYTFRVNGSDVGLLDNFKLASVLFMLVREGWSILESLKKLGVKIPKALTDILKKNVNKS